MNKRYKITIEERQYEETLTDRKWTANVDQEREDTYGYTPQVPQQKIVTREVYKQDVNELDLVKVIKAVNGID